MALHNDVTSDYLDTLRRRYDEFKAEARQREADGQGPHYAAILYYTPVEVIEVAVVTPYPDSDVLQIQGVDSAGIPCDIIAHPHSAQVVLKVIPPSPEPPARRPAGFTVGLYSAESDERAVWAEGVEPPSAS